MRCWKCQRWYRYLYHIVGGKHVGKVGYQDEFLEFRCANVCCNHKIGNSIQAEKWTQLSQVYTLHIIRLLIIDWNSSADSIRLRSMEFQSSFVYYYYCIGEKNVRIFYIRAINNVHWGIKRKFIDFPSGSTNSEST